MADQNHEKAIRVFRTLCRSFDDHHFYYDKFEEDLSIRCRTQGDDLPIEIVFSVDEDRQFIGLLSKLPFVVGEDLRLNFAVAISAINFRLVDGSFDFNIASGDIFFRLTSSFIDSDIDDEVFKYMLFVSSHTIDDFNDKLLMLAKNYISLDDFLAELTEKGGD